MATQHVMACNPVPGHSRELRTRQPRAAPASRLSRKSWVSKSFVAAQRYSEPHTIAEAADWTKESSDTHSPGVVVCFDRSVRKWATGRADDECNKVIGGMSAIVIATDGSFDPSTDRAG